MTRSLDLAGQWRVMFSDGMHGVTSSPQFNSTDPERFLTVPVPLELHRAMQGLGLAGDPNLGMNFLSQRWIEEQFWQYQHTFTAPRAALGKPAWLVFEQLDCIAGIYLNGEHAGSHATVHRPCRIDVTGKLREGENQLIVTLESGLYSVADKEGANYGAGLDVLLHKRHWLRKPQYEFGWDWNGRLINVGITGPVRLEWAERARLDQVAVWTELAADHQQATLTVRAFIEGLGDGRDRQKPVKATLRVRVKETGQEFSAPVEIKPGLEVYPLQLTLDEPRLWWPAGQGEQFLYTLEISVEAGGKSLDSTTRRTGIRSIRLDRSKHPVEGEYFILEVNGRPIFCKGGNWVPADLIPSAVTRERTFELVRLAVEANFNLLRLWGGGCWAGHDLLDACDEMGVLVWHDLLFACSKYPGDNPEFLAEVRREVTWGAREFAAHPALAVWCGNNELEWGAHGWGFDKTGKSLPDYALFHHVIPVVLKNEDPVSRPYWPSSPYSPDHIFPNDPTVGDQHPWGIPLLSDSFDFWAYRGYVDRFPNEGGYLGASSPATLRQFLPEGERSPRSPSWERHDNATVFWKEGVGFPYGAIELWLGRDWREMDLDEYIFASALLQAEALREYIGNYRRRMFSSSSAIFWMYNDSWPVTHGWTIIDYYLRKKLSWHPVRRAFQPVSVVVAEDGDNLTIYGVNDSPAAWSGKLRYGFFGCAGGLPVDETIAAKIPANRSVALATIKRSELERRGAARHGAFALLTKGRDTVAQHRLLLARFKELGLVREPEIEVRKKGRCVELTSPVFVWGACVDLDGEAPAPDNCFDLLPGISYCIPWPEDAAAPRVLRTGNGVM